MRVLQFHNLIAQIEVLVAEITATVNVTTFKAVAFESVSLYVYSCSSEIYGTCYNFSSTPHPRRTDHITRKERRPVCPTLFWRVRR